MRPNVTAAHLDGISSGIPQFRFILRQLDGSGLDWAFHCSAHKIQRVQEYGFDGALMQRDLTSAYDISAGFGEPQYHRMIDDNDTDFERISCGRGRNIWCTTGTFNPAIRARAVESLLEY